VCGTTKFNVYDDVVQNDTPGVVLTKMYVNQIDRKSVLGVIGNKVSGVRIFGEAWGLPRAEPYGTRNDSHVLHP